METVLWKGITIVSLLVAFASLIIGIISVDKASILLSFASVSGVNGGNYKSCRDIKTGRSGIYTIQPDPRSPAFPTYCDLEVSGGGWTLVASVHENNIDGKCTPGDKWSSEQGTASSQGTKNWENRNVFGMLEAITDQDYKNPAYYSLDASDVMLWHVPNQKKVFEISKAAILKYHTNNKFLNKSSMQYLYAKKLPLKTAVGGLDSILQSIQQQSVNITSQIPFWFNYNYDRGTTMSSIQDGGRDMYDGGNTVAFGTNVDNFTTMNYNSPYFLYGSGLEVKSASTRPFVSMAWVGKGLGKVESDVDYFQYRVTSNFGADGRGNTLFYNTTTITVGSMTASYTAFQVSNATDPSVCEVYFYISNTRWNSQAPQSLTQINWQRNTREAANTVRFTGKPRNVLIGYTLLSKAAGRRVFKSDIEAVLRSYLNITRDFTFKVTVPHLAQPVEFYKGNKQKIMDSVPLSHRKKVQPGYIQFRAFNSVGLPNALCPGVLVRSNSPEQMCIGGASTVGRDLLLCGDYAGWKGNPGDPGSLDSPSQTGKSINDIKSSILIFVR